MQKFKIVAAVVISTIVTACGSGSSNTPVNDPDLSQNRNVNGFHMVSGSSIDGFGRTVSEWQSDVDYDQNRVEVTYTYFAENGSVDYQSISRSEYDNLGRLVQEEYNGPGGFDLTTYEFNNRGWLVKSTRTGGAAPYTYDFQYNDNGQLLSKQRQWTRDGEVSSIENYAYVYTNQGLLRTANRIITESTIDPATGERYSTSVNSNYSHDSMDRITRRERITSSSYQGNSTEDSEISDFVYDQNGNMVQESTTDSTGSTRTNNYRYARSEEPIYNLWLRRFRYFP